MARIRGILVVAASLVAWSGSWTIAAARDAVVTPFDGTPPLTHFYPARTLDPGEQAPTVVVGPGWATAGYVIPTRTAVRTAATGSASATSSTRASAS